jgi:hypothetical protein
MPRLDLTDAAQLKKVVIEPLIEALRNEMRENIRPLIDEVSSLRRHDTDQDERVEAIERRLAVVERFKLRIAAVCSGIAIVTGVTWRTVLDWAKEKLAKH